nr:Na(+)/H(+) antiporter subunit C [Tomitella gaofuii]
MMVDIGLLVVVAVLVSCGVYLLMERSIVKMLLGLLLGGNGINLLLILAGGGAGNAPIIGTDGRVYDTDADPLSQAMILTAIVISMGLAAFVLALAYRAFTATNTDDDVEDDPEDTKVGLRGEAESPLRDRTADPVTGRITRAGDQFGPANASEEP